MKLIDALLVSVVIGLSLFTLYLFASDYPYLSDSQSREPEQTVEAVVLHTLTPPHAGTPMDFPFHIVLGPKGPQYTVHWERNTTTRHTQEDDINSVAVAIAIDPKCPPEGALSFLAAFCKKYQVDADKIVSHEEVEETACRSPGWDVDELRNEIKEQVPVQ